MLNAVHKVFLSSIDFYTTTRRREEKGRENDFCDVTRKSWWSIPKDLLRYILQFLVVPWLRSRTQMRLKKIRWIKTARVS